MPDPVAVNEMFGRIAGRYDFANHALSGGLDFWWRRVLVRAVARAQPQEVLDLATGSGDVAFALQRVLPPRSTVTGMDFCQPMLEQAERKRRPHAPAAPTVRFCRGDMADLPLPDRSLDAVTIAFGLRNAEDRHRALQEMRRVLRTPDGCLFVLEFSQPYRWFAPLYFFYLRRILPRIAALFTGDRSAYDYLCGSIERFPDHEGIADEIRRAGFKDVRAVRMTFGTVALHIARV